MRGLLGVYLVLSVFLALPAHWAAYHRMFAEERPHLTRRQARVRSSALQLTFCVIWPVFAVLGIMDWGVRRLLGKGAA